MKDCHDQVILAYMKRQLLNIRDISIGLSGRLTADYNDEYGICCTVSFKPRLLATRLGNMKQAGSRPK